MDAAEAILLDEGYAAISSRNIARRAGLKHQVIFYYFDTLQDLLIAVYRRSADDWLAHIRVSLASDQPLRIIWDAARNTEKIKFFREFFAIANHNAIIRDEMVQLGVEGQDIQIEAVRAHLARRGKTTPMSPELLVLTVTSLGYLVAAQAWTDAALSAGHTDAHAYIEGLIASVDGP